MKIALIGVGNVGKALIQDLQNLRFVREIVLIGRNREKLMAEVQDLTEASVVKDAHGPVFSWGGYERTAGADIILYTAGTPKLVSSRLELAQDNAEIAASVFSEVKKYNTEGIVLCISNPLDVITTVVEKYSGRPSHKVLGTGTLLETSRLTHFVANLLDVSPRPVQVTVIGEHGDSCVPLISSLRIAGKTLEEFLQEQIGDDVSVQAAQIKKSVARAGHRIYEGKGYTNYGISAVACRIISAIGSDAREILPVSTVLHGQYGVDGIAISVPCVVGKDGIASVLNVNMTEEERAAFQRSADVIREALQSIPAQIPD